MQTTMTLEACARCGQPIAPGEPRHADRLGGHHRRTGGPLPGEVLPPEGPLLRRDVHRRESLPNAA